MKYYRYLSSKGMFYEISNGGILVTITVFPIVIA